ncbi:MAG TPA: hypothetical protein VHO05_11310 [Hyphomicrobium sp.]|nr:hypothetical protein [Hyphomicrobium sp.]HEX2841850.1 hypothetical protein [Hyphomicrobium sp.]
MHIKCLPAEDRYPIWDGTASHFPGAVETWNFRAPFGSPDASSWDCFFLRCTEAVAPIPKMDRTLGRARIFQTPSNFGNWSRCQIEYEFVLDPTLHIVSKRPTKITHHLSGYDQDQLVKSPLLASCMELGSKVFGEFFLFQPARVRPGLDSVAALPHRIKRARKPTPHNFTRLRNRMTQIESLDERKVRVTAQLLENSRASSIGDENPCPLKGHRYLRANCLPQVRSTFVGALSAPKLATPDRKALNLACPTRFEETYGLDKHHLADRAWLRICRHALLLA